MFKAFLIVAIATIIAPSCVSPKAKKATQWNNQLAEISKMNQSRWNEVFTAINEAHTSRDFTKVSSLGKDLVTFLEGKIAEVSKMENTEGSEKMKAAMIEFLEFEKNTAKDGLSPYQNMSKETPDEEVQATFDNLKTIFGGEEAHLAKLRLAQQEYASKYGLEIKEQ